MDRLVAVLTTALALCVLRSVVSTSEFSAGKWTVLNEKIPAQYSYHTHIENDIFLRRFDEAVTNLIACLVPTLLLNLLLLISFFMSPKKARQRPYDLFAGMVNMC